nr:hypothetical protein [Clostridia bacterium]
MEENNENVQLSEKEERKKRLRDRRMARRAKHNARIARCRFFKNLFIWFLGVIFLPVAIAATAFVVPISVITGNSGEYVSEDLSNKSLFEAIKYAAGNYGELGFADFPIIGKTLKDLEDTDIGDGKTVGDIINIHVDDLNAIKFGDEGVADKVRDCVEVIATLDSVGGTSMLGDFGNLSVFSEAEEVGTFASMDTTAEGFDAQQYYYLNGEKYERVYNDDGTPTKEFEGTETVYYPPLAQVKLDELVNIVDDAFGRLKIVSLLETFNADNETLVKILGEDMKVKDLKDGFDINTVCLNDVMPKDSGNEKLYEILQDLTEKEIDNEIVRKNYDEITIGDLSESFKIEKIKLETVVGEYALADDNTKQLYDVLSSALNDKAVSTITIEDLTSGTFNIENIRLETVMGTYASASDNTKKLYDVLSSALNDKAVSAITIADLTGSGFNVNSVKLKDVLTLDDDTYDILCEAVEGETKPDKNTITIGDLSNIDIYNVSLDTVLDLDEEDTLNKILKSAVNGTGTGGAILLKDLTPENFDTSAICLNDVMPYNPSTNKMLYDILQDLTETIVGGEVVRKDYDEITIQDISTFNTEKIRLTSVLPAADNPDLYDILVDLVDGASTPSDITLSNLSTITPTNIHLTTVLPAATNETLYKILRDATGVSGATDEEKNNNITLDSLTSFTPSNIHLTTVLPDKDEYDNPTNETLYNILREATGVSGATDAEKNSNITLDSLSSFTPTNIHLTTVLPDKDEYDNPTNETLYKILRDATGVSGATDEEKNGNITLDSLSSFTPSNIHLNTVLEDVNLNDNSVLLALQEQNIVISEIGDALNNLSLYEVYGKTVFVEIEDGTEIPVGARRFNRVDDADGKPLYFEYNADGDYYLKNNAGIWLILCFDTAEYDANDNVITRYKDPADGNPYKYVVDDMKIQDLQSGSSSGFSRKFKNATLKQLIDTGLVDDTAGLSNDVKALSLQEIIAILADPVIQSYIATLS